MSPIPSCRTYVSSFLSLISGLYLSGQSQISLEPWGVPPVGGEILSEPSPEVAAMRRYDDFPVSYASGTVDINIPLFEIPGGAVNMPIGLSYHAGGIKKTDRSTAVGLGWTLTGLGQISRQVVGYPDERRSGDGTFYFPDMTDMDISYFKDLILSKKDAQIDIYSYNFQNYSGKFIIIDKKPLSCT